MVLLKLALTFMIESCCTNFISVLLYFYTMIRTKGKPQLITILVLSGLMIVAGLSNLLRSIFFYLQ